MLSETHLAIPFWIQKQDLAHDTVEISPVRSNETIEVAFSLGGKVEQGLPRALDDFELAERLKLTDKMDHFCLYDSAMVPVIAECCRA